MSKGPFTSSPSPTYDHVLWTGSGRWRGVLAILLAIALFFLVSTVITIAAFSVGGGVGGTPSADELVVTPVSLLAVNLSLAAQMPIAVLMQWLFFGVRPRWMSSVEGRFRWRWFGRLALLVVPLFAVYAVLSFTVVPLGGLTVDAGTVALLLAVVLSTPLQAAGEEYAVRGLVQRSVGSWFRNARVALVVSTSAAATVFAAAHATPDPWQIAYYLVFGIAASISAWGTGGLEAGVLVHGVNNLFILAPLALTGGVGGLVQREAGTTGAVMLVPMGVMMLSTLLCVWMARRSSIATRQIGSPKTKSGGFQR